MATGSGNPPADERPVVPARAATETLSKLYDEHAHDLYATFTPVQWANGLHGAAEVHRTDWFHLTNLVLLSRAQAHRDSIARLTDVDRTAFFDYTGRILRLLEGDSAAHCMAAQGNGQGCPNRSSNGLPYCKRHSNHGLPLLAHDDDGVTGHGHSYACFGCGQPSDDHPSDSEDADGVHTFNCATCAASITAACAAKALGADRFSAPRSEPTAPLAPFTLTSAVYNKLVEAIAALTGKVDRVVRESRLLKAQAQDAAPRAVPAAPRPPPEAAPSNYTTPAELLPPLLDLLPTKPIDDKARQWHELHGYQPPANPAQPYPDRHHLEAYHIHMIPWHWELLHVVDSPLFDNSPDGEWRVETILGVTGRIRLMHAVQKACEHGDGGPALSWPSAYAYMQRYHRTYLLAGRAPVHCGPPPGTDPLLTPGRPNPNPARSGPKASGDDVR
eukprot:jgi/Tetstr1/460764/TSEL_005949.t1